CWRTGSSSNRCVEGSGVQENITMLTIIRREDMKTFTKRALGMLSAVSLVALTATNALAQEKRVIGVSIPAATHGWTGGVVYHADSEAKRVRTAFSDIYVLVKSSSTSSARVSALEAPPARTNLHASVILPFTSEDLSGPVEQVKAGGTCIT